MNKSTFPINIKQMPGEDDETVFTINGNAAVFDVRDDVDHIIQSGAFEKTLSKGFPPFLWQHDRSAPIGVIKAIMETDQGLFISAEMPRDDTFVSGRIIPQVKIGAVKSLSIGFNPVQTRRENGALLIDEIDLKEISLVTMPANRAAQISSFKGATPYANLPLAPLDRPWSAVDARARVRQFTDSVESPSADYKKAFLYYDEAMEDEFGAYKFPFADVVDGELKAVLRALNNAAARVGNSTISERDQVAVRANVDRYQEKAEREREENSAKSEKSSAKHFDFKTTQNLSYLELKNALMGGLAFSREAANFIASSTIRETTNHTQKQKIVDELKHLGSTMQSAINHTGK